MGNCESGSCSTEKEQCSTKQDCGTSGCDYSSGCCMTDHMMGLANDAWSCLMKEKMKKLWQEQNGEQMDKMAEAAVALCQTYWKNKMEGYGEMKQAEQVLQQTFMK